MAHTAAGMMYKRLACTAGGARVAGARRCTGLQSERAGQGVHVRRRLRPRRRHTDHLR